MGDLIPFRPRQYGDPCRHPGERVDPPEVLEGEVIEPGPVAMVEHRVKLTRDEFIAVANGTYRAGDTPEHGAPVTIIDKRGRNNPKAERRRREEAMRKAKAEWAQQAAGSMFWQAQHAARNGRVDLADSILTERAAFVAGAQSKGILSQ